MHALNAIGNRIKCIFLFHKFNFLVNCSISEDWRQKLLFKTEQIWRNLIEASWRIKAVVSQLEIHQKVPTWIVQLKYEDSFRHVNVFWCQLKLSRQVQRERRLWRRCFGSIGYESTVPSLRWIRNHKLCNELTNDYNNPKWIHDFFLFSNIFGLKLNFSFIKYFSD